MSVTEIKEALQKLSLAEMDELTHWMNEQRVLAEEADADAWDKQIEADIKAAAWTTLWQKPAPKLKRAGFGLCHDKPYYRHVLEIV